VDTRLLDDDPALDERLGDVVAAEVVAAEPDRRLDQVAGGDVVGVTRLPLRVVEVIEVGQALG